VRLKTLIILSIAHETVLKVLTMLMKLIKLMRMMKLSEELFDHRFYQLCYIVFSYQFVSSKI